MAIYIDSEASGGGNGLSKANAFTPQEGSQYMFDQSGTIGVPADLSGKEFLFRSGRSEVYSPSPVNGTGTSRSSFVMDYTLNYRIGSYDEGIKPLILSSIIVSDTWINESGNIWYIPVINPSGYANPSQGFSTLDINYAMINEFLRVATKVELTNDYLYWLDTTNNRHYITLSNDPNAVTIYMTDGYCMHLKGIQDANIGDLDLRFGWAGLRVTEGIDNVKIFDIKTQWQGYQSSTGERGGQQGIVLSGITTGFATACSVKFCESNYCHNNQVEIKYVDGAVIEQNKGVGCVMGIELWRDAKNCSILRNSMKDIAIRGIFTGNGRGLWSSNNNADGANTYAFNYVENADWGGLSIEKGDNNLVHNNTFYNCLRGSLIDANDCTGTVWKNNLHFKDNTDGSTGSSMNVTGTGGTITFENNIYYNEQRIALGKTGLDQVEYKGSAYTNTTAWLTATGSVNDEIKAVTIGNDLVPAVGNNTAGGNGEALTYAKDKFNYPLYNGHPVGCYHEKINADTVSSLTEAQK